MIRAICFLIGHDWTAWRKSLIKGNEYRYCKRCTKTEQRRDDV